MSPDDENVYAKSRQLGRDVVSPILRQRVRERVAAGDLETLIRCGPAVIPFLVELLPSSPALCFTIVEIEDRR